MKLLPLQRAPPTSQSAYVWMYRRMRNCHFPISLSYFSRTQVCPPKKHPKNTVNTEGQAKTRVCNGQSQSALNWVILQHVFGWAEAYRKNRKWPADPKISRLVWKMHGFITNQQQTLNRMREAQKKTQHVSFPVGLEVIQIQFKPPATHTHQQKKQQSVTKEKSKPTQLFCLAVNLMWD